MTARVVVPYIVKWSDESGASAKVVAGKSGIAYADETLNDRDQQGVLWTRWVHRPGSGRPRFGDDHPMRQRRAMRKLLCMVCGKPADQTDKGALWLLRDHREDWPDWPNSMANAYPPVCLPCAQLSIRICPALRKGYVVVRGHAEITGVFGMCYRKGQTPGHAEIVGPQNVAYDDPLIRWTRAAKLIRSFHSVTVMDLDSALCAKV
jgi:hypothetical protein